MADTTVIAVAAISAGAALAGSGLQTWASRATAEAEADRQEAQWAETRRTERRETYQTMLDLLTDFGWRSSNEPDYDVVSQFNIPFLHAANRVRMYGSPAARAALDRLQEGFAMSIAARTSEEMDAANAEIRAGTDLVMNAAREDVGPRAQDGLRSVPYRDGIGPPAGDL